MIELYKRFLIVFFCIAWSVAASAYHIIGGEIYYDCLGEDPANPGSMLYKMTLKIYRDCAGVGQDFDSLPGQTIGTISIFKGNEPNPFMPTTYLSPPDITLLQPDAGNPCLVLPPNICVQEGIYEFEISLPVSAESYHVTYQRCCRNSTISNIYNPDETGSTYTVEITPTAQTSCNSSPSFNNFPPIVICVDQPLNFDHSATDAEGDQLVYELCTPLKGGGLFGAPTSLNGYAPDPDAAPATYVGVDFIVPDYSALAPLGGNPVVTIDPFSGLITGIPTVQGQFVVGICVKEYRNGALLSTIQRDFQFNVAYCEPTVVAELEGDLVDDVYVYNSCDDSTFTFKNNSYQSSFIDEYFWVFDVNGTPVTSNLEEPTITFPGPGQYLGTMFLNPGTQCSDSAFVEVNIAEPIIADFTFDYDTCVAGPVDFTDLSLSGDTLFSEWLWNFGDGAISAERHPSYLYADPDVHQVSLTVTDAIGCSQTAYHSVNWFPAPPIIIVEPSSFVGCPPAEISFENLSSPIDETYDIIWDFGDGGFSGEISPDYIFHQPGLFDINIEITSPIGCFTSRRFVNWISIDSFPIADFDFNPKENLSNFNATVEFTDQSIRAAGWNWRFGETGNTILQNPVYTFPDTGRQEVELIITHVYGCQDTLTKIVDIVPKITYFMPNAFTPNNDARNDFFRGGGYFRGIRDFNMRIYNRWGELIFITQDPSDGWNGRKNNIGRMSQNGVYTCLVQFTGPRGTPHEYRGFATLIR